MLELQLEDLIGFVLSRRLLPWPSGLVALGYGLLALMAKGVEGFFALLPSLMRFDFRPLIEMVPLIGLPRRRIAACFG